MKNKLITSFLAVLLVFSLCVSYRSQAVEAVASGVSIGILAWQLLGVMTGQYDEIASAMGQWFDNAYEVVDEHWADGWHILSDKLTEWVDNYSITIDDDGKVRMKYSQYLELFDLVGKAYADLSFLLSTSYDYISFRATPDLSLYITNAVSVFPASGDVDNVMLYFPIFYNGDVIYFPDVYACMFYSPYVYSRNPLDLDSNSTNCHFVVYRYDIYNHQQNAPYVDNGTIFSMRTGIASDIFLDKMLFYFSGNASNFTVGCSYNHRVCTTDINWTSYDGLAYTPVDSLDSDGLNFAYLDVAGVNNSYAYGNTTAFSDVSGFFDSLFGYAADSSLPSFDDLSDVLPLDKTNDPTLEIDTDPSIAIPTDAVTVTDIPGQADVSLTDLKANTRIDLDIPSVISTKFPFCIPYDFIRIIGVFCADPVAPVFRIPISTNLDNLKGFEDNQAIGELPEDFKPMFEIDEEIVIDLSAVPLIQPICYTVFIVGFVVLLIHITPKMINH